MNTYLISYDLITPGRDYQPLYDAIKKYGTWCHPLESIWIIKSNESALDICNKLLAHVDTNDKLLVIRTTSEAAWVRLSQEVKNWLNSELSN